MAACLFAELRAFLIAKARAQPGSITGPTTGAAGGVLGCKMRRCTAAVHPGKSGVLHLLSPGSTCFQMPPPSCPMCAVGVITPYREQRKLLRQTFEEVCGKGPASEVRMARRLVAGKHTLSEMVVCRGLCCAAFCCAVPSLWPAAVPPTLI